MTWGLVAVAGSTLVSGVIGSRSANKAADAQAGAAQAGIDQQNQQFAAIQKLLDPYVQGGYKGLSGQLDLAGANGNPAQQAAIDALMKSPQFTSAQQLGENRILANASATGGLRGGNVQGALAQFNPALLASTINDQYARLGGLTSIGQNAAAGVGNAGMATGNQVSNLLQQQGAATAGGYLAQGRAGQQVANSAAGLGGYYWANNGSFKSPATAGGTGGSNWEWTGSPEYF